MNTWNNDKGDIPNTVGLTITCQLKDGSQFDTSIQFEPKGYHHIVRPEGIEYSDIIAWKYRSIAS